MSTSTTTPTEDRALTLLGQGLPAEVVASAIGVTPSRISQLISDPEFAAKVAELRFLTLSKHNERDSAYDRMESKLQERMENLIPMMYKPGEVLKAIQIINAAKRRGSSTPEAIVSQQNVVNLTIPTQIIQNFSQTNIQVNPENQVIKAGAQDLVTIQSNLMTKLLALRKANENVAITYEEGTRRTGTSREASGTPGRQ